MDAAYEKHERGEIDADEYFNYLRDLLELKIDSKTIKQGWNSIFIRELTESIDYVHLVKLKLPCYVFTNSNPTHQTHWEANYPRVVNSFSRIFVSSELGLRKPEPAAFKTVANAIGLSLEEILFFDDTRENVDVARTLGMQAMIVRKPSDIKTGLGKWGIL